MNRRKFAKNIIGLGLGTCFYTWQIEPFWLEIVRLPMPINNLPESLVGKTLMQISDIHVGNDFDYKFIIESFEFAQEFDPDIVVYTGDYVSYENSKQFEQLNEVLKNTVHGKLGTIGVLGNHDYGYKWSQPKVAKTITKQLSRAGMRILRNEKTKIDGLNILGIDDYWATNFFPKKVMRSYKPKNANLVLCHNPDVCDLNVWNGYQGWILSGHTHGGQCKAPFLTPPILPVKNKKYSAGKIDLEDGRILYISRALGHSKQVRFNVRPEITLFTLECSSALEQLNKH